MTSSAKSVSSGEVPVRAEVVTLFEDFFEGERVRLFRALFAITGNRHEADDISQEAFLRLWERWDRVSAMDDPAGYLHQTAMNVFRDRRRRIVLGMKRAIRVSPAPRWLRSHRRQVGRRRGTQLTHPETASRARLNRGPRVLGRGVRRDPRHQRFDRPSAPVPGALHPEGLRGEER
jgi:DNA-directed RNA polymerase specialized sigma24 family protein